MDDTILRKHYDLSESTIESINKYMEFMGKNKKLYKDYSLYTELLKMRKLLENNKSINLVYV